MEKFKVRNILKFFNIEKRLILFLLVTNLCFLVFITLSSYSHIPLSGFKDYGIYLIHLLLLQFSVFGFIYFLTLNKWVFRIVFNLLFILLCLLSFWTYTQDISVTESLLNTVFQTKTSIIIDVLSYQYLFFILLSVLTLIFINKFYNSLKSRFSLFLVIVSICSISTFFLVEAKRFGTFKFKLPYSLIFGLANHFDQKSMVLKKNIAGNSAKNNVNIVFVLGETVRADHLSFNGYERETMPRLKQRKNVISYPNIFTPYSYTAASLPVILTDYDGLESKRDSITSIYDVFNKLEYNTLWIGNQELESGYKDIVKTNHKVVIIDSLRSIYSFKKSLDEDMLNVFELPNHSSLTTIQMIGSHWYYNNRVSDSFRSFKPISNSKYIPSQSKEQLINSYDNTILYLDYFLDTLITKLENSKEPVLLVYLSDHGENLGEDGLWLHAQESEYSKNPAMLLWFSKSFRNKYPKQVNSALKNTHKKYSTAFFFHSMLGLIEPKNIVIDSEMNIFNSK